MRRLPLDGLFEHAGSLKGKIVLITGAGSGFGRATAEEAASHGAHVIATDVNEKALAGLRKLQDGNFIIEKVDVTVLEDLQRVFKVSLEKYGLVPDIVIVNAGVNANDHFEEDEEIPATRNQPAHPRRPVDRTLNVNMVGAVQTAEVAKDHWRLHPSNRRRKLVLLSSMGGLSGIPFATMYSTSKHAIMGYWKATCEELEREGEDAGFECWTINPFFANTPILAAPTFLALAGIPLAPVRGVVGAIIFASSCPTATFRQDHLTIRSGTAVLILDDGPLALASPAEYEALSGVWGAEVADFAVSNRDWAKHPWARQIWSDVLEHVLHVSPASFLLFTCMVPLGLYGAKILVEAIPAVVTVLSGAAFVVARHVLSPGRP